MTSLPITPPTSARAAAAPKSASPPPGAAGDFAALLDQTSARTAPAEGPKNRPAPPEPRDRDAAAPKDDNKGTATPDAQATPIAEPARPTAEGKPTEATQGQSQPATAEAPAPVADPAVTAATTALAVASATQVAPAMALAAVAPVTVPAVDAQAVTTAAAAAQTARGDAPAPADAAATPADGAPAGKLQIPAELLNASGGQTKDFKNGDQPRRELPPAPTLPPTADAAATPGPALAPAVAAPMPVADPGAASASAPAPASPPTATAQIQPAAAPATAVAVPGGAPQLSRASVAQTAERVQELVRIVATRAGTARAVLQLRPAELGQVDVHLRTTRNGLVATIAAHEQVGLDALQQAGNELRRTLEDKGVQLHSLDLQLGAGGNGFTNQGDAREASSGRRGGVGGSDSHDLDGDEPDAEDELTITHAPSTPAGALVDVQA